MICAAHTPPPPLQSVKRVSKGQQTLALPAPGDDESGERALVVVAGGEEETSLAEFNEAMADTELQPLTKAMQGKGLEKVRVCGWGGCMLGCWAVVLPWGGSAGWWSESHSAMASDSRLAMQPGCWLAGCHDATCLPPVTALVVSQQCLHILCLHDC